jgi:replicative DNA helicase
VLGCLLQKPDLLIDSRYNLDRDDFDEIFHKMIFASIYNLYLQGTKKIDCIAIDNYLSSYELQYKIFNENNGMDYILECQNNSKLENFDYYYQRIKKFTLLRDLVEEGTDIKEIYDETIVEPREQEKMQAKFDNYSVQDIFNIVDKKIVKLKNKHLVNINNQGQKAGKGLQELKEKCKDTPDIGIPMASNIMNTIARGARLKKFYLRSAPTGIGKCVVGNTLIYTDKGLIKIEDIPNYYQVTNKQCVANIVSYDINNAERKILPTSHWFNMGLQKTKKITTKLGYEIEGTYEHPIVVSNEQGDIYFKKIGEIEKTDKVMISLNNNMFGTNEMDLDIAYLLGFLTGDGYNNVSTGIKKRNKLMYSKQNEDIYQKINTILKEKIIGVNDISTYVKKQGCNHEYGNQDTIDYFENICGLTMNTSLNKNIPTPIMTGTKLVVKNFLQGLFDTDGSITNGFFEYSTASKRMSHEVHIMLLNFGIISRLRTKIVNGLPYYVISILNRTMLNIFKDNIGFKYALEKQNKLDEIFNSPEVINNNIDLFYGKEKLLWLHNYLKKNVSDYKYNRTKKYSYHINQLTFYESLINGRNISRERIRRITNNIDSNDRNLIYINNISNNMCFVDIDNIIENESIVYDFTVPNTHSFVANGLINHNSRLACSDACSYSIPYIWSLKEKKWMYRGISEPTLYITTELEIEEVQTMIIAYISGVEEDKILDGRYTGDEEERVDQAIQFIEQSPLWIEYMSDFNIEDIETVIRRYQIDHKVQYVLFDYIHTSMKLISEIATASRGMRLREDQVLLMFSDRLKSMCNKLNIHIDSATQTSGEYKNVRDADQNVLRGAKSLADKIDLGVVVLQPTKTDIEALQPILSKGIYPVPNMVYHIYKVRRGKLSKVKLWLHINLGNLRIQDLFLTNSDYQIIPVESTKIEMIDAMLDEHSIDEKEIKISKEDKENSSTVLFNF